MGGEKTLSREMKLEREHRGEEKLMVSVLNGSGQNPVG